MTTDVIKAEFTVGRVDGSLRHGAHFSRELFVLPFPRSHFGGRPKISITRQSPLDWFVERSTEESQGKFSIELVDPRATFNSCLTSLVYLPGITAIVDADRYSIFVELARCLDATHVLRSVAEIIRDHFYPTLSIDYLHDGQVVPVDQFQPADGQAREAAG